MYFLLAKYNKEGTKLIIPESFKELEEDYENRIRLNLVDQHKSQMNFLKIKPLGESIITSGWIKVSFKDKLGDKWVMELAIPILEKNEEIFIAIDRLDKKEVVYNIEKIKIRYQTQVGEKMLFESIRRFNRANERIIKESHKIQQFKLFYKNIQSRKSGNMEWIYLNNKK